ncbi:MAG: UbiA family prenyltransferase [Methanobacterium sp.]|uniref:UbiA family prenyltransferase n=1 Tax=Methanobacterium sp. TaxID=2164 RepID=UPI003C75E0BD
MLLNTYFKNSYYGYFNLILKEIIHGGYLTALGAPALVLTTSIITRSAINLPLLIISYLIPLIIYSYDYMSDLDKDVETNSDRYEHLQKKKKYYPLIMIFYIILLIALLIIFSNYKLILFIILITLGGFLYATVLKGLTKKIPIFKNIYTVLTWSLGGTLFVPLQFSLTISLPFIIVFLFINMKGMINAIFFDLKDSLNDSKEGLKTLPVILGKKNAIKLLHLLNLVSFIPLIIAVILRIIPMITISLILFFFYSFYYLNKAQKHIGEDIWVRLGSIADFEFIFWPVVLMISLLIFNSHYAI